MIILCKLSAVILRISSYTAKGINILMYVSRANSTKHVGLVVRKLVFERYFKDLSHRITLF
jgi:hypothetical protein